jgi:hypothetical protein
MEILANLFGSWWPAVELTGWTLIKVVAIVLPLMVICKYALGQIAWVILACCNRLQMRLS